MILLVSQSAVGAKVAETLGKALDVEVQLCEGLQQVRAVSKGHSFEVVVLDESSLDLEGARLDALLPEGAVAVGANLVLHGPKRMARMVTLALRQREREQAGAVQSAAKLLRSELRTELTGILLAARQALEAPELPLPAAHKIQLVCDAAERIRARLEC